MRRPFWMALALAVPATSGVPAVASAGCGDGVLDEGETCEKNEDNAWALFGKTCEDFGYTGGTLLCQVCKYNVTQCTYDDSQLCGNGLAEPGEMCDRDNHGNSGDRYCTDTCQCDASGANVCGDGCPNVEEQCDNGSHNSDTQPDQCRTDCRFPACGDDVQDRDEQCDDGSGNADYAPNACRDDCTLPYCGDGVVDWAYGEQCDEAGENSDAPGATCNTSCIVPGCGNGYLDPWEQCDDGNIDSSDGCTEQCRYNVCGDGYVRTGAEQCEYDQPHDPGDCRYDCGQDPGTCGDGQLDPGEGCDDGVDRNSDQPGDACRTDCQPQRCGDGIVDPDEQCDRQVGCAPDCRWIGPR